MSCRPRWHQP